MRARVDRWREAWETRDCERIVALYAPGATHASPLVPRLYPEAGGTVLRGHDQIREYFRRALGRFTTLRFEIASVTETESRAAVEYHRHSNVDADRPAHVLELIEWSGAHIAAVRVFHFPHDAPSAGLSEHYQGCARYNAWMNERLYEVCATLTEEERRRNLGAFFGSIHGTLNHLLLTDRAWLGRFSRDAALADSLDATGKPIPLTRRLDQELYADFDVLRRERAKTDAAIAAWAGTLDATRLTAPLVYRTSAGQACEHPLWWAVTHFFNHQTHHRGQVTTLLKQLGHDPGVTDLIVLLRS
jgi:uncharacterized damage-inducible protein DinB